MREDIQAYLRILGLIVHYELENTNQLAYYERAAARFLSKKNRLLKSEKAILHFFRKKIYKMDTKAEIVKAFAELKKEITVYLKDPFEERSFANFDIISWLNSKIENKPFAEIAKRKTR